MFSLDKKIKKQNFLAKKKIKNTRPLRGRKSVQLFLRTDLALKNTEFIVDRPIVTQSIRAIPLKNTPPHKNTPPCYSRIWNALKEKMWFSMRQLIILPPLVTPGSSTRGVFLSGIALICYKSKSPQRCRWSGPIDYWMRIHEYSKIDNAWGLRFVIQLLAISDPLCPTV